MFAKLKSWSSWSNGLLGLLLVSVTLLFGVKLGEEHIPILAIPYFTDDFIRTFDGAMLVLSGIVAVTLLFTQKWGRIFLALFALMLLAAIIISSILLFPHQWASGVSTAGNTSLIGLKVGGTWLLIVLKWVVTMAVWATIIGVGITLFFSFLKDSNLEAVPITGGAIATAFVIMGAITNNTFIPIFWYNQLVLLSLFLVLLGVSGLVAGGINYFRYHKGHWIYDSQLDKWRKIEDFTPTVAPAQEVPTPLVPATAEAITTDVLATKTDQLQAEMDVAEAEEAINNKVKAIASTLKVELFDDPAMTNVSDELFETHKKGFLDTMTHGESEEVKATMEKAMTGTRVEIQDNLNKIINS